MKKIFSIIAIFAIFAIISIPAKADDASLAAHLVDRAANSQGICSLPRCTRGSLAVELKKASGYIIHAQNNNSSVLDEIRSAADTEKTLNLRIYTDKSDPTNIFLADKYVDLLAITDAADGNLNTLSVKEIKRVISPSIGKAILCDADGGSLSESAVSAWITASGVSGMNLSFHSDSGINYAEITRTRDSSEGDWSHWYNGPDNSLVSSDTALKFPYLSGFFSFPLHGAEPNCAVLANGRAFRTMGNTSTGFDDYEAKLKDDYFTVVAHNAYNGRELWRKKVSAGTTHKYGYIATDDVFYLINSNEVQFINADTGELLDSLTVTGKDQFPKWIALYENKLFVLWGEEDLPNLEVAGAKYVFAPFANPDEESPWGKGNRITAHNLDKTKLWDHSEPSLIYSRNVGISTGKLFFNAVGTNHWKVDFSGPWPEGWQQEATNGSARVAALNTADGTLAWENTDPSNIVHLNTYKNFNHELGRARMNLFCSSNYVYIARAGSKYLMAFSAIDGTFLWKNETRDGRAHDIILYKNELWTWGLLFDSNNPYRLNPATGEKIGYCDVKSSGCARHVINEEAIYSAAGRGKNMSTGESVTPNGMKSGCNSGAFPANGMLYSVPTRCKCNVTVRGFVGLSSAGDDFDFSPVAGTDRLESTGASPSESFEITDTDWPTHRKNNIRSAYNSVVVGTISNIFWTYIPEATNFPTAAVAAGNYGFVAGTDGKVRCFNMIDGSEKWSYTTGGKIMATPTVWSNRVYVGAGDGCVYSLDAGSGDLLWKYRLAPYNRKIMVYDYLSSTWPVNSGVTIHDGVAYAAAGIYDWDGTHVFALNAITGEKIWQNSDSAFVDVLAHKGISAAGYFTILKNKLWMASGNYSSPASYNLSDGTASNSVFGFKVALRGREMGVYGTNHVVFGGFPMQSLENEWKTIRGADVGYLKINEDGQREYNEVTVNNGAESTARARLMPAWDWDKTYAATYGDEKLTCWDTDEMIDFITEAKGDNEIKWGRKVNYIDVDSSTLSNSVFWQRDDNNYMYGYVLSADQLVVLYGNNPGYKLKPTYFWISGRDRNNGSELWKVDLPGEPLIGGLAISKDGSILVPMKNGNVLALKADAVTVAIKTSVTEIDVPENGTASFDVSLSFDPVTGPVTVNVERVSGGDENLTVSSGSRVVLNSTNWNIGETVTLAAADDVDTENGSAVFRCSAKGLSPIDVTATEMENDIGIVLSDDSLTIGGGASDTFGVKITLNPGSDINVTCQFVSGDSVISVSPAPTILTFNSGNWMNYQYVTVNVGTDLDTIDGSAVISCFSGDLINNITIYENDPDQLLIELSTSSLDINEGETNFFELSLSAMPVYSTTVTVQKISGDSCFEILDSKLVIVSNNVHVVRVLAKTDGNKRNETALLLCVSDSPEIDSPTNINVTAIDSDNNSITKIFQDGLDGYSGAVDSYVSTWAKDSNYGSSKICDLDKVKRFPMIKWDLTSVPSTAQFSSATISVTLMWLAGYTESTELNVYTLKTPWTEYGVTWNTSDGSNLWILSEYKGELVGNIVSPEGTAGGKAIVDINLNAAGLAYLKTCVTNPAANCGFIIVNEYTEQIRRRCYLRETDDLSDRPKLTLKYSTELPEVPTNAFININNGDMLTSDQVINITLYADTPTPYDMQISEAVDFSDVDWAIYTTTYEYSLSEGYGPKTVYARFSDGGKGISETISDSIDFMPEPLGIWIIGILEYWIIVRCRKRLTSNVKLFCH